MNWSIPGGSKSEHSKGTDFLKSQKKLHNKSKSHVERFFFIYTGCSRLYISCQFPNKDLAPFHEESPRLKVSYRKWNTVNCLSTIGGISKYSHMIKKIHSDSKAPSPRIIQHLYISQNLASSKIKYHSKSYLQQKPKTKGVPDCNPKGKHIRLWSKR